MTRKVSVKDTDRKRDNPESTVWAQSCVCDVLFGPQRSRNTKQGFDAKKIVAAVVKHVQDHKVFTRPGNKFPQLKPLIASLVWPFVARRSMMTKRHPFEEKEFFRFQNSITETAKRISFHINERNDEQTYLKYFLNVYLCKLFRDDQLPEKDEFIDPKWPLFSGWCKKFLDRRILKRDASFVYSLQKGAKQAWPKLGEYKEKKAQEKHKSRMTVRHGEVPRDLDTTIRYQSRRIFGVLRPDELTKFIPSTSACLEATRQKGGCLSLVAPYVVPDFVRLVPHLDGSEHCIRPGALGSLGTLRELASSIDEWRRHEYIEAALGLAKTVEHPEQIKDVPYMLHVKIMDIPEPGKFRILSLGEGYYYIVLQPLQGALLSCWKRFSASTMLLQNYEKRIREIDQELPPEEGFLWYSVDYEAATDLLKKACSMAVLESLNSNCELGRVLISIAQSAIREPGSAKYPDGETVKIVDGQLMGHPLSFPLLCLINYSVYQCAIGRWVDDADTPQERTRRLGISERMDGNVLVNGDDMLFKAERSLYSIFIKTANDAGFKISVGKNYCSRDTCMINSKIFQRNSRAGKMSQRGYLNQNLLHGVVLKSGESSATPVQLGEELSRQIDLCPWTACTIPYIFERFKKDHVNQGFIPNWYVPAHLGGYGLHRELAPESMRITREQRQVAAQFVNKPSLQLYRMMGKKRNEKLSRFATACLKFRLVKDDYEPVLSEGESLVDESDPWLMRICYAAQIASGANFVEPETIVQKLHRDHRLAPMTIESMESYWGGKFVRSGVPDCPPLGFLHF